MSSRKPRSRRLVTWLLRSQFADLADRSLMLITLRGRRSGREFTFPVQYARDGDTIWILPGKPDRKRWWRNLVGGAPVVVRIRGRRIEGSAQAFRGDSDPAPVSEGIRAYGRRFQAVARKLDSAGDPGGTVVVRVDPAEALPAVDATDVGAGAGISGAIRKHPLRAFYLLTFILSWGYWIPDALSGGHLSHFPGLMGPMVAALVVGGTTGGWPGTRDLLSRMARWRVSGKWYGFALAPLAVAAVVTAGLSAAGKDVPKLGAIDGLPDVGFLGVFVLTLIVNGFGEETGWRGFALPRWRERHGPMSASLLIALPWALWHVPTFFIDSGYRGIQPVIVPAFFVGLFAGAIVSTWLYENAASSVWIVALWHTCLNMGSATDAGNGAVAIAVSAFVIFCAVMIGRSWQRELDATDGFSGGDTRALDRAEP